MKRTSIIALGLVLSLVVVTAGVSLAVDRNSAISIDKPQQDILEARGLDSINISELVCDGNTCRSCSNAGDYGMGCISIPQQKCTEYNETDCTTWEAKPTSELELDEAEAYANRWEGIADTIVERESRTDEVRLNKGGITVNEAR